MSVKPVTLIALLRGVNVGGSRCKMEQLREAVMSVSECVRDGVSDGVSECVKDGVRDEVSDGVSERVSECVSECVSGSGSGVTVHAVKTYLQSGNIILTATPTPYMSERVSERVSEGVDIPRLESAIRMSIREYCGFAPHVFVMTLDEYATMLLDHSLTQACSSDSASDMKSIHMYIFPHNHSFTPTALIEAKKIQCVSEEWVCKGRTLLLHTPSGFGVSKLARKVESIFGSPTTARNWRSVVSILNMARGMSDESEGVVSEGVVSKGEGEGKSEKTTRKRTRRQSEGVSK
jgi:uncharacterized protein (DUF1697 family)